MVKNCLDNNADKSDILSDCGAVSDRECSLEKTPGIENGMSTPDTDEPHSLHRAIKKYEKKCRYEEIIRIVTQNVHKSLNLNEVICSAIDVMNEHIEGAQNVSIYMVEDGDAVLKYYRGYPAVMMKELARIPYPKGFTWETILDSKPTYCPDVDWDTVIGPLGRKLGTKSYVSMPIRYSGKAIGCININSLRKFAFDREELDLLEIVTGTIEVAINNARRAEALKKSRESLRKNIAKLRRKNRFERVINAVAMCVHQSLEISEVFENAVEAIYNEVNEAQHIMIYMVEEVPENNDKPYAVMKAQRGHPQSCIERIKRIPYPLGATWETIMDSKPRYVPDSDVDPSLGKAGREYGARSYISMPIKMGDDTVGCIQLHSFKKGI